MSERKRPTYRKLKAQRKPRAGTLPEAERRTWGARLKQIRLDHDLCQAVIAELAQRQPSTIQRIEAGKIKARASYERYEEVIGQLAPHLPVARDFPAAPNLPVA